MFPRFSSSNRSNSGGFTQLHAKVGNRCQFAARPAKRTSLDCTAMDLRADVHLQVFVERDRIRPAK